MPLATPRRFGLSSRAAKYAAMGAVVAVVGGGVVVYTQAQKTVNLSLDGRTRQVSEFADTVGELLKDQDVKTTSRDLVVPEASSPLKDGQTVVVRFARQLTVTEDGQTRTYWTTENTVSGALAALGLRADNAKLSVSRSAPIGRQGLTMALTTPKTVKVKADGATKTVTTTSATVADLLTELNLKLGTLDKISVVPSTAVTQGLALAITRISTKSQTATESVGYSTKRVSNSSMYKGQTKVSTAGKNGSRQATYRLTYVDGKLITKKLVTAHVTVNPVTQVVQVGTKARPASSSGGGGGRNYPAPGGSGLNWAAVAQCESGGNPRSIDPPFYGLYQFMISVWHEVGGSGLPSDASASEQTYRAQLLYNKYGSRPWPVCGKYL